MATDLHMKFAVAAATSANATALGRGDNDFTG